MDSDLPLPSSSIPLPSSTAVGDDDHGKGGEVDNVEVVANLPLLIAGPAGSGKSYELVMSTLAKIWTNCDHIESDIPLKALCLAPYHTSLANFSSKLQKGMEELRQLEAQEATPRRFTLSEPICDTIHHTCRRWLAAYGHLIDLPRVVEVCTRERTHRMLEVLTGRPAMENLQIVAVEDWDEFFRETRRILEEELTIAIPNIEFLAEAVQVTRECVIDLNMGLVALEDFIRLYKIYNYQVTGEMRERFDDEIRTGAATDVREYYDRLLRHNLLYDFEDLVIFGARLVQDHANHIIKAEKIGFIVLDDLQNTYGQQRQFIQPLTMCQEINGRLITACHDHELAQTIGGQPWETHRSAYEFAGSDVQANPDELMGQMIDPGLAFERIDLEQNLRSSYNIQQVAYGLYDRNLFNVQQDNVGFRPILKSVGDMDEEARYIQEESEKIHLNDAVNNKPLSSITVLFRTNENVRFLVDSLSKIYAPIRVMGLENNDICSNEAIDLLSFFGSIQDTSLHHLVERSLGIFAICNDLPNLTFNTLPSPDIMRDFIERSLHAEGTRHILLPDDQRDYLDLLVALKRRMITGNRSIRGAVEFLIGQLQYKERILRTRLATDGSPSPAPQMNEDENLPNRASDYTGARWENVQAFLRRVEDFDQRFSAREDVGHIDNLDLLLRECHAYAPDRLRYLRRNPEMEITLSTMHYAIG